MSLCTAQFGAWKSRRGEVLVVVCPCARHNSPGVWELSLCTTQFDVWESRRSRIPFLIRPCAPHNLRQRQPCPDSGDKVGFLLR